MNSKVAVMSQELYSVEQVAALLGLHVKTVRAYVREGRLKATRIGKQYRIVRADLEALTGAPAPVSPRDSARRHRHIEVSSVVMIDAVSADTAQRVTTMLTGALKSPRDGDTPARIDTIYDEERARLKIIVSGSVETTTHLLAMISVVASAP
jgi:excisionase family DNA binding protein